MIVWSSPSPLVLQLFIVPDAQCLQIECSVLEQAVCPSGNVVNICQEQPPAETTRAQPEEGSASPHLGRLAAHRQQILSPAQAWEQRQWVGIIAWALWTGHCPSTTAWEGCRREDIWRLFKFNLKWREKKKRYFKSMPGTQHSFRKRKGV